MARDAVLIASLLVFIWLGLRVYHDVDRLTVLGHGVATAGAAVTSGFRAAGAAAQGIPIVGGAFAGALKGVGTSAGGNVEAVGLAGEHSAHHLAEVLGLLTWALPTALILLLMLPARIRQVRRLEQARALASARTSDERQRLVALRALLTLPDDALKAHTSDPADDMLAGRYSGLVTAAIEDLGLRTPPARRM
jgi:hypothetical protein